MAASFEETAEDGLGEFGIMQNVPQAARGLLAVKRMSLLIEELSNAAHTGRLAPGLP